LQDSFEKIKTNKQAESLLQSAYNVYLLRTEIYNYGVMEKNNYNYVYKFAGRNNEMLYSAGIQLAKRLNELYK